MAIESVLQSLRLDPGFMGNVVRWERTPARAERMAGMPAGLHGQLVRALAARGVNELYAHQALAVEAALAGRNVVVATPAASGKTLCYNLPVLHQLLTDGRGRALYLFPTKALAHDQLAGLSDLAAAAEMGAAPAAGMRMAPAAYDGDTPSSRRAKIRDASRIILTNPDMLHMGILPQHPRWAALFASLRVVVIDEMHVYRGVFGSHVANVLRRLRRICRFYGAEPQFILASATIANPAELAERLIEAPVTLIGPEQNGAPRGERHTIFYNPPIVDPDLGIRRSSLSESAELAARFIRHDVQTIVFGQARLATELLLAQLRDSLPREAAKQLRGYRGGYLPSTRREIEQGLRGGQVRGVVATNALELGIDIGQLDASILVGYPGSVASARQQMGRAGRRQGTSGAVLVAGGAPLDQYIVTHPRWLLDRSPEHARINPDNEVILAAHLACAAAELPLREGETLRGEQLAQGGEDPTAELLEDLVTAGQLYAAGGRYYWGGEGVPAQLLSLRSSGADRVVIQARDDAGQPSVIGELDRESVPLFLYEGAIYLHEGASYVVERLDWDGAVATVRAVDVDFYTRPVIAEQITVLRERLKIEDERLIADSGAGDTDAGGERWKMEDGRRKTEGDEGARYRRGWGDVRVTVQATGYRILRRGTNELLGFGEVDLPEQVLDTEGCWLVVAPETIEALKAAGDWLSDENDYGPQWTATRAEVRRRDGYRCQACGAAELGGRQHDVHHKIPFRAFLADPALRGDLPAALAWQAANKIDNLVTLCAACHHRAESGVRTRSGLGGAAALLEAVAPLFLMCDGRDLGIVAEPQDATTGQPTITLYERTPGGVGLAEQFFHSLPVVLQAALELAAGCPCERGCLACVGPILEHDYALDTKQLSIALLRAMVGGIEDGRLKMEETML